MGVTDIDDTLQAVINIVFFVLLSLIVLVIIEKVLIKLIGKCRASSMLSKFKNTPKDKVILHAIWRCKTLPSISPFALKLETYLRMAKIPYELETKNPLGPKGKLPWISYNGTHIADSQLCIQFLNKTLSPDLNKNATQEKLHVARACRVILEERFFWGLVRYRTIDNRDNLGQIVTFPKIIKFVMAIRGSGPIQKRMESQGIGLHDPSEIYKMTGDDLRTVSGILGRDNFFGGEQPCEEDCAIFGILAQCVWAMPGSVFERLVNGECSNLKEYCERMKDLYWPDWEKCLENKISV